MITTNLVYQLSTFELVHKDKILTALNAIDGVEAFLVKGIGGMLDKKISIVINDPIEFDLNDALILGVIIGQTISSNQ